MMVSYKEGRASRIRDLCSPRKSADAASWNSRSNLDITLKGRSLHRPFDRLQNGLLQDAPGWRIMVGW